jgi:methyltransferase (TIGR00027 family)
MQEGQPSRTAVAAAAQRAAHQRLEAGSIFKDALATVLLGPEADRLVETVSADPAQRHMRIFLAARSRFAEDCIDRAVARGTRQIVIVGAGLDTFSLRNPHAALGSQVFEVDHPATQAWKRKRLSEAGVAVPASLIFAPVDFEQQNLAEGLAAAGYRAGAPTFFHWLGVVPYLRRDTVMSILRFVAGLPGSEIVFDYSEPLENYGPERRARVAEVAARTAAIGEPWLSFFDPVELARELRQLGFHQLEDIGLADIATRYLGVPATASATEAGPHVISARRL